MHDPDSVEILTHENGVQLSPALARAYKNHVEHDPSDLAEARRIAGTCERLPVGIIYRNPDVPCYEDLNKPDKVYTPVQVKNSLDQELDKFTIWPRD